MRRHTLPLLALLNVALALALAWMWLHRDASLRNVHWAAPQPVTSDYLQMLPPLPALAPVDTSRFLVLLERPLFALNRRPPPPVPVAAVAQAPVDNFSTATLSGMVSGPKTGTVIIHIAGKNRRVKLNESVEGWMLKNIQGRTATFVNGEQTRSLQLPRAAVIVYQGAALPGASAPAWQPSGPGVATAGEDSTDANPGAAAAPAVPAPAPARRKSRFGP